MQLSESPWAPKVIRVEYLGLCAPGCTEPLFRIHIASRSQGSTALDVCLSEEALTELDLALEQFSEQRQQLSAMPKQ